MTYPQHSFPIFSHSYPIKKCKPQSQNWGQNMAKYGKIPKIDIASIRFSPKFMVRSTLCCWSCVGSSGSGGRFFRLSLHRGGGIIVVEKTGWSSKIGSRTIMDYPRSATLPPLFFSMFKNGEWQKLAKTVITMAFSWGALLDTSIFFLQGMDPQVLLWKTQRIAGESPLNDVVKVLGFNQV